MRLVCGDGRLQFAYSDPDHLYVCLQDPTLDDSMITGTNHKTFFTELSIYEKLSEHGARYRTRAELRDQTRSFVLDAGGRS